MKSSIKYLSSIIFGLTISFWSATALAEVVVLSVGSDQSFDKRAKPLTYAAKDASAFADTMIQVGAVPPSMVTLEKNPLIAVFESKLKQGLERLKASADTSKNKFVFFFSGHADERGLHFRDGFFSKEALDRAIASLPAKTKVMIIDSCFAGLLSSKGVKGAKGFGTPKLDFDEPTGSIYLTASSSNEFAYESQKLQGGLFSHNVIDGLHGKADLNGDGVVTATELYEYAFRETRLTSRMIALPGEQNPEFVSNLRGRGAIALSFPVLARGNVRMMSDLGGSVHLYAAKGLNSFEHAKVKGADDTISLPTGDYQIEVVDGNRRGMGQIRVASTSTTLLTRDDINWNSTPSARNDVRSRGIESTLQAQASTGSYHRIQASLGTMGLHKYLDAQLGYERLSAGGWFWPAVNLSYTDRMNRQKREENDILDSSKGILVGVGAELPLTEHSPVKLSGFCYGGVKSLQIRTIDKSGDYWSQDYDSYEPYDPYQTPVFRTEIVPVVRSELRASLHTVFLAVGGERPLMNGKSRGLGNIPMDFVTTRLGFNIAL